MRNVLVHFWVEFRCPSAIILPESIGLLDEFLQPLPAIHGPDEKFQEDAAKTPDIKHAREVILIAKLRRYISFRSGSRFGR